MNTDLKVIIKVGSDLTAEEMNSIDKAKAREWHKLPMDEPHRNARIFALLKDSDEKILAQAQLHRINDVTFNSEIFSVLDIGAVIAHEKGKGYGAILMKGIIQYLKENKEIGIGFTGSELIHFFEKSGFNTDCTLQNRFVEYKDGVKRTFSERECIFFFDPEDKLFKNILNSQDSEVLLPRDPDW